jgi:very-short-patch-repair endonuclease
MMQDALRDKRLQELGYTTVRIAESEVMHDFENVIRKLVLS